jgi:hypothetical protein
MISGANRQVEMIFGKGSEEKKYKRWLIILYFEKGCVKLAC